MYIYVYMPSTQTKHNKLDGIGIAYGDCLGVQSFLLSFAGREDIQSNDFCQEIRVMPGLNV